MGQIKRGCATLHMHLVIVNENKKTNVKGRVKCKVLKYTTKFMMCKCDVHLGAHAHVD